MKVEEFLSLPLVAHVAVNAPGGPTVRPVWFLFEDGMFWWLTSSSYSRLARWLAHDARAMLVVDHFDVTKGEVLAVTVAGEVTIEPLDASRARRKLTKYLGPDVGRWPDRFQAALRVDVSDLACLHPAKRPRLRDLSFEPPGP